MVALEVVFIGVRSMLRSADRPGERRGQKVRGDQDRRAHRVGN